MKMNPSSIALVLGLLTTGCAGFPSGKPESSLPLSPAVTAKPDAAVHRHVAGPSPSAPSSATASPAIAQVGFRDHSGHSGATNGFFDAGGCPSCGPVAGNGCAACMTCPPQGTLPMAMVPVPWQVDPQEFLCDGGDHDPRAFLTRGGNVVNLQAEDTVTHYVTEAGNIEFAASNRVCVYAPRFGSVRRITGAVAGEKVVAAIGFDRPVGPVGINLDLPSLVAMDVVEPRRGELTRRVDSMRDRNRGVVVDMVQQPLLAQDVLAVLAGIQNIGPNQLNESQLALLQKHAAAAIAWTFDNSVEVAILDLKPPVLTRDQRVDALVVYDFPDAGRLNLIKLADRQHVPIGEVVTFALRLQNVGDSAVSDVTVIDNLTTRLEYVADSSTVIDPATQEPVDAQFKTMPNSSGSSKLSWTLPGTLKVGDTVVIEFQCRVR